MPGRLIVLAVGIREVIHCTLKRVSGCAFQRFAGWHLGQGIQSRLGRHRDVFSYRMVAQLMDA